LSLKFEIDQVAAWNFVDGKADHLFPIFSRCKGGANGLFRRDVRGRKKDLIELMFFEKIDGEIEMPEVDWIESASKKTDFFGGQMILHCFFTEIARSFLSGLTAMGFPAISKNSRSKTLSE